MVNANEMCSKVFSIRFQKVTDIFEPRTADFVVDEKHQKEFFQLIEQFGLVAIYTENDVWHIKPGETTDVEVLKQRFSTWDIMLHKYFACGNDFRRKNAEYHRKTLAHAKVIPILQLDLSPSGVIM